MALLQVIAYSNVLEMDVSLTVVLPQTTKKIVGTSSSGVKEDVPVVYLLHGMGGNHSSWERKSSIERYVTDMEIAVIMPSTDLGWYTDTTYDMNYWTFISEELPDICHELFPQLTRKREKTFAIGLSMGGYGALKLGLAKPDNFAAIASLSGAVDVVNSEEALLSIRKETYWQGIFGSLREIRGSINDPRFLIEKLVASGKKAPALFLCCGEDDFLLSSNKSISDFLNEKGINHRFELGPGEHNWIFWDEWIQKALEWLPLESEEIKE